MLQFLSDEMRRDPYPMYEQVRNVSPVLHEPVSDVYLLFDCLPIRFTPGPRVSH